MRSLTVGFYGMTHLGLVSAAAALAKGCRTIAYDPDETLIMQLRQKNYPIEEPQFSELIEENAERLYFTAEFNQLLEADLIYLAMDVPTDDQGYSDLRPIRAALEQLRKHLRVGQIIVVLSQVPPGFIRELKFPEDQLFYQVETLVFGNAIERASKPERFIVGCAHPRKHLPKLYERFLQMFRCPILTMRYESAELAKVSINMYLVSSVMTSNFLADIASNIGADWKEVVPALCLDKRIGQYAYLNPGLGISGGNLERDMMTLSQVAQTYQVPDALVKRWMQDNDYYKQWVWRCLQANVFPKINAPRIAILGLTYKPNTHSIKNSPSLALINLLKATSVTLLLHDPVAKKNMISKSKIVVCHSVLEALQSVDAVVIMTPWPEYYKLTVNDFLSTMRGQQIVDPYRVLNDIDFISAGFSVYTLGVNLNVQTKHQCLATKKTSRVVKNPKIKGSLHD